MHSTPLRPISYSLQFRGRVTSLSARVLEQRASAPSQVLTTTIDTDGLAGRVQPREGDEAVLVARLVLENDGSFHQSGTIEFAPGHVLAFRSVGAARLGRSPDPHLRHGAAVLEVDGGEGQFHGAHGRITSNFFVSDTDELTDNHFGVIFITDATATQAPEPTRIPPRRLGIRETWAQFRRSGGVNDLLAESALWTTPWIGFPPYQERDCAEEFTLSAAAWRDVLSYDDACAAQAPPPSIDARPRPRRRRERS